MLAVIGALELDLEAVGRHDGEQAILVGDAEGLEEGEGFGGEGGGGPEHVDELDGGGVADQGEGDGAEGEAKGGEVLVEA